MAREFNFDGLVGPSHNYGGLSFGNVASAEHEGQISSPRKAALQGLAKMRTLHDLGVPQGIFPPHLRPDLSLARRLGFRGDGQETQGADTAQVLAELARELPLLLAACWSASAMWTANAATVSPSADSADGRLHFTPANLQNKLHRSIEAPTAARILRAVFPDPALFAHHEPLPATAALGDEGAANHTRFAPAHGERGVQLFVYGESAVNPWDPRPKLFPARHTREASEAVARLHRVPAQQAVFAQQNPEVIDQGVFHNDVISVGNLDLFLVHELAFLEQERVLAELQEKYLQLTSRPLRLLLVPAAAVPIGDAVSSYLFNSQLVHTPDGKTVLVAPRECEENDAVRAWVRATLEAGGPLDEVVYLDLRQSMQGGGGPACLRLRVVLTEEEEKAVAPGVLFTPALHDKLVAWVEQHYRDSLRAEDLADVRFVDECRAALDELSRILGLTGIYPFQL